MCMWEGSGSGSVVKKTQDSEVKRRKEFKTKSNTLLSFFPTHSFTHSNKETLVLLCNNNDNKNKDISIALQQTLFFLPNTSPLLFNKDISIASHSQLNATLLNHFYLFPTKTHVL